MKYAFKFPRVDAETIIVEADSFGAATDTAVGIRMAHATPTRIDGEIHKPEPSLTNPSGGKQ